LPPYGKRKKWCVRVVPSDDLKWNDPGKETSGHRFFLSNVNLLASYIYIIKPKFGYVKVESAILTLNKTGANEIGAARCASAG
jgi:hypothetical protein